jgi:hypothetical protein
MLEYLDQAKTAIVKGISKLLELAQCLALERPGEKARPEHRKSWIEKWRGITRQVHDCRRAFRDSLRKVDIPPELGIDSDAWPWSLEPSTLDQLYQSFRIERRSDRWMDVCDDLMGHNKEFWEGKFRELRDHIQMQEVKLPPKMKKLREELRRRWTPPEARCKLSDLKKALGYNKEDAVYKMARRLKQIDKSFHCERILGGRTKWLRFAFGETAPWEKLPPESPGGRGRPRIAPRLAAD